MSAREDSDRRPEGSVRQHRETVGFVGLGRMGWPMAARVAASGRRVVAFDLDPDRVAEFAAATGAERADDPRQVAEQAELVVLMLPDGEVVREVVLGSSTPGMVVGLRAGALVIDASSSAPTDTVELGERLAEIGVGFVDAPVSGGVARARAATLAAMVGGAADLVEAARPLLSTFSSSIFHVGRLGAGHAVKALNNAVSAAGLIAAAESLVVAARLGIEPATMLEVLNASSGRNNATEAKIRQYVFSGSYASGFELRLMVKDLRIAIGLAREAGIPTEVTERALDTLEEAERKLGAGADHTEVARYLALCGRVSLEGGDGEAQTGAGSP